MATVRYPLHAYKTGDWKRAKLAFSRMAMTTLGAATVMRQEAHALKGRIHEGLWSGEFDRSYRWPPLSSMTIEKRQNPENPKLIDSGGFSSSIRVMHMGWNVYGVGIPKTARDRRGQHYAQIGMVHELGLARNNWGRKIPARPFWSVEYGKSRKRLAAKLTAALKAGARHWRSPGVGSLRAIGMPSVMKTVVGSHVIAGLL